MLFRKVSLTLLMMMAVLAAPAQAQSWWSAGDGHETGKLTEIKQKRKVFLNVAFTSSEPEINAEQKQTSIRRLVTRALAEYKGLEIVGTPDQAELTIGVTASMSRATNREGALNFAANLDPDLQAALDVTVFLRGRMQRDGTYRPRVVWGMSSQNVFGEPGPAAVFAIDGFIDQLKKARGEKK